MRDGLLLAVPLLIAVPTGVIVGDARPIRVLAWVALVGMLAAAVYIGIAFVLRMHAMGDRVGSVFSVIGLVSAFVYLLLSQLVAVVSAAREPTTWVAAIVLTAIDVFAIVLIGGHAIGISPDGRRRRLLREWQVDRMAKYGRRRASASTAGGSLGAVVLVFLVPSLTRSAMPGLSWGRGMAFARSAALVLAASAFALLAAAPWIFT